MNPVEKSKGALLEREKAKITHSMGTCPFGQITFSCLEKSHFYNLGKSFFCFGLMPFDILFNAVFRSMLLD